MDFEYIKDSSPSMYEILSAPDCTDLKIDRIEKIESKHGQPNFKIHHKTGSVTLHTNYSLEREEERIYSKTNMDRNKLTIAFGLGCGYHLHRFLRENPNCELIIIEPSYKVLYEVIRHVDLKPFFKNTRIKFLISVEIEELSQYLGECYTYHRYSGIQFLTLPSYEALYGSEMEILKKNFLEQMSRYTINLLTIMESKGEYTENCMLSTEFLGRFPWAYRLFNQFQNVPTIIISAGPSLHLHFERLRELKDKALLISVDTALPILKQHGITPHMVCTADPTQGNFIHMKGLDLEGTYLVIEPMTYSKIPTLPNVKAFIANFQGYYSSYLANFARHPSEMESWGSIASTCFNLAVLMGSNPIIFVGQDLAYSDFLYHCPKSRFDDNYRSFIEGNPSYHLYTSYQGNHILRFQEYPIYAEPDILGGTAFTQKNMKLYAGYLTENFVKSGRRVINASERGILKEGCEIMTLQQVQETIVTRDLPIAQHLSTIYAEGQDYDTHRLLLDVESKLEKLQSALEMSKALQTDCQTLAKLTRDSKDLEEKVPEEVRQCFNRINESLNCGINDETMLRWVDYQNQKAEMFFKRKISQRLGEEMTPELIEELAEFYYNYLESRVKCFSGLLKHLNLAREGCLNSLGSNPAGPTIDPGSPAYQRS